MSRRDLILIAVIGGCILLTAYLLIGKPFSPKFTEPPGAPRGVHVVCGSAQCGFGAEGYNASARDPNWPKKCPTCGKETLYLAVKCPYCGKFTPGAVPGSMESSIKCMHCGKSIRSGPPSPDADPSTIR